MASWVVADAAAATATAAATVVKKQFGLRESGDTHSQTDGQCGTLLQMDAQTDRRTLAHRLAGQNKPASGAQQSTAALPGRRLFNY